MIEFKDFRLQEPYKKAIISAINKTLAKTKTFAKRELSRIYNIKPSDVDKYMNIVRATTNRPKGWIAVENKRLALSKFSGTKQTASGVTVKIRNMREIPNAFIAVMESGHKGVFKRTGTFRAMTRGSYAGKTYTRRLDKLGMPLERETIKELTGPSLAQLFGSKAMTKSMQEFAGKELREIFVHELQYFITKGR